MLAHMRIILLLYPSLTDLVKGANCLHATSGRSNKGLLTSITSKGTSHQSPRWHLLSHEARVGAFAYAPERRVRRHRTCFYLGP